MLSDFDVVIDNGDHKQGTPHCQTNSTSEWNPLHKVVTSSLLSGIITNQLPTMVLREQRRMWTPKITDFCSQEWYGRTMLDGRDGLTPPVGLNFIRGLFRQQFHVDGNFVVIVVPDMRLMRDERSIFNRHTQQIAFNCCDNLKETFIANEERERTLFS